MQSSEAFETMLAKHLMVARVIWIGFTAAIFLYAFVGYVVSAQGEPIEMGSQDEVLRYIMCMVGLMMAAISIGLKLTWFSRTRIDKRLSAAVDLDEMTRKQEAGRAREAYIDQLKSLAEAEQKVVCFFNWYLVRYIGLLSLNESVAIVGLVLTVITSQPMQMFPFLVATLLLNARLIGHPRGVVKYARSVLQQV